MVFYAEEGEERVREVLYKKEKKSCDADKYRRMAG